MESTEGKTGDTQKSRESVSTRLGRIAEKARKEPGFVFTSLMHHLDLPFLEAAYDKTRKGGAPGVDGVTAREYEKDLAGNLRRLWERLKAGTYVAPPVKRTYIPKDGGRKNRPIGIPTFEDKVVQRAVVMLLEAIYEQDFLKCSHGFRPRLSAHTALESLWQQLMDHGGGWVYEVDIKNFFGTLVYQNLREFLDRRVRDGSLRRLINKWLKAGVMEGGEVSHPEKGTPQGGVISPLLANIYLHEVLDRWFEDVVKPCLGGWACLIRYADDFVIVMKSSDDARRVMKALPERLRKYGLEISPEKTRLVPFRRPPRDASGKGEDTFDLLGFTHYWKRSLKGNWAVSRKTMRKKLTASLKRVTEWCKMNRHRKLRRQHEELRLKLRGHYGYYGITGNSRSLQLFYEEVKRIWFKWLNRRSQRKSYNWEKFNNVLRVYVLPRPKVVHSVYRQAAKL
jgi:RNA-directed DNA polymerase